MKQRINLLIVLGILQHSIKISLSLENYLDSCELINYIFVIKNKTLDKDLIRNLFTDY